MTHDDWSFYEDKADEFQGQSRGLCSGRQPMNEQKLRRAMQEAERFLEAAQALLDNPPKYSFEGTRYTAAAKRASMDLTRALADFRGRNTP